MLLPGLILLYLFQIAVVGDTDSGKTALVQRFVAGYFRPSSISTTTAALFSSKRIQVHGITVKIKIWDTAGRPQFRPLARTYIEGSAATILCFDVSSPQTHDALKYWSDELSLSKIPIFICGTKSDQSPRIISNSDMKQLAAAMGALYLETSAKNNTNVTLLFKQVAERILLNGSGLAGSDGDPTPNIRDATTAASSGPNTISELNIVENRPGRPEQAPPRPTPKKRSSRVDQIKEANTHNSDGEDEVLPDTRMCGIIPRNCQIM